MSSLRGPCGSGIGLVILGAVVAVCSSPDSSQTISHVVAADAGVAPATDSVASTPKAPAMERVRSDLAAGRGDDASVTRWISPVPERLERCRVFLAPEASLNRVVVANEDAIDKYFGTHSIGVMVNLGDRWALGGSADVHWAIGSFQFAPSLRCRRWFGRLQSVEASLGYVPVTRSIDYSGEQTRLSGPIVGARYSPTPEVFLQLGVCRFEEQTGDYVPPDYRLVVTRRDVSRAYFSLGVGSGVGYLLWTLGLIALGVLALVGAALEGM